MSGKLRLGSQSLFVALVLAAAVAAGCQKKEAAVGTGTEGQPADTTAAAQPAAPAQPALAAGHIEVQHVLIGFTGSVPGKDIKLTQEEARKLAYEILDRAKKGENFDQLVQQYTADQFPGIYRLADHGVAAEQGVEYERAGMVKGFGDVAFGLKVGDVGIADYDRQTSPYGWHVIKRLR